MIVKAKPEIVLNDLGDKVVAALAQCVESARNDYATHRLEHPDWVADATGRGSGNFIHDRMWAAIAAELDGADGVMLVDKEPFREVVVNARYCILLKRHDLFGGISGYPTQRAMDFWEQDQYQIDGTGIINLVAGYEWDKELRKMGRPVLSLRNARDDVLWVVELPSSGHAKGVHVIAGPADGPVLPSIIIDNDYSQDSDTQ